MQSAIEAKPLILVYGVPGVGKTTDMIYSFPNAYFVANAGALKSAIGVVGLTSDQIVSGDVDRISDCIPLIDELVKQGYDQIVFDDFSALCERTISIYQQPGSSLPGYKAWGKLKEDIINFRNYARDSGILVAVNCWEQSVKLKDTSLKDKQGNLRDGAEDTFTRLRGCPKLPSDHGESLPALFDNVFRATFPESSKNDKSWQAIYVTQGDNDWIAKNRDGGIPVNCPLNIGEIIRFIGRTQNKQGYILPRANGLEWQEEAVEKISQEILTAPSSEVKKIVEGWYSKLIGKKLPPKIARWTLRDSLHRKELTEKMDKFDATFF